MIDLHLRSDTDAPARARHALDGLEGTLSRAILDDTLLLVSELVTNSVRHTGQGPDGWVRMVVSRSGEHVRVEVSDPGPGFEPAHIRTPSIHQISGWGLYLVEQVASRWGVEDGGPGTLVWFEVGGADGQISAAEPA